MLELLSSYITCEALACLMTRTKQRQSADFEHLVPRPSSTHPAYFRSYEADKFSSMVALASLAEACC
jgi:hypothetical protein